MRLPSSRLHASAAAHLCACRQDAGEGTIELFYYIRRKQGTRLKYNARFPSESPSDVFWFKSRNLDNFLRSFLIGIPIWILVEVLVLWRYGNGIHAFGKVDWQDNWQWLVVLTLLVPAIHEIHFFCIHRLSTRPFSTSTCIRCTTIRSTRRPDRRCRCTGSSTRCISARSLGTC